MIIESHRFPTLRLSRSLSFSLATPSIAKLAHLWNRGYSKRRETLASLFLTPEGGTAERTGARTKDLYFQGKLEAREKKKKKKKKKKNKQKNKKNEETKNEKKRQHNKKEK